MSTGGVRKKAARPSVFCFYHDRLRQGLPLNCSVVGVADVQWTPEKSYMMAQAHLHFRQRLCYVIWSLFFQAQLIAIQEAPARKKTMTLAERDLQTTREIYRYHFSRLVHIALAALL